MLFVPFSFDLDEQCGDWTREQLVQQNERFVAAVERAFELGLESRATAEASCLMNGKQRTDEITIELAWRYLRSNMDAGLDVSSAAIIARCPGVALERVRAGVRRRLMESVGS